MTLIPLPLPADAIPLVRDGALHYRRCARSGRAQEYMHRRCLCCWDDALEIVPASGKAELVTWVRYHRTYHPQFPHPHTVAVARLAEGVEIFAALSSHDSFPLRAGLPLQVEVGRDGALTVRPIASPN